MKRLALVVLVVLFACAHTAPPSQPSSSPSVPRILLFTRTKGFNHASIPAAVAALKRLGVQHVVAAPATRDPGVFTDGSLAGYRAVVFLLTTGDVLNDAQ